MHILYTPTTGLPYGEVDLLFVRHHIHTYSTAGYPIVAPANKKEQNLLALQLLSLIF